MNTFLNYTFFDNTLEQWLKFIILVVLAILLKKYISILLGKITYRPFRKFSSENEAQKFTALLSQPFQFIIVFTTIYFAFKSLHYPSVYF